MNAIALGVLFVGVLFGLLLGPVWKKESKSGFKAIATVGVVLFSGTIVAFVSQVNDERWMYPIGLVVGFIWSKFSPIFKEASRPAQAGAQSGRSFALAKISAATIGTLALAYVALSIERGGLATVRDKEAASAVAVKMPCRLVWVHLGRYGNEGQKYITPPAFRYADQTAMHGPIPSVGDRIVMVEKRNLVVAGYGSAETSKKCNRMLEPPSDYRPETASEFIAGSVQPGQEFLINELSFLPNREAEPTYVWASVRLP